MAAINSELIDYINEAFEDARKRIRCGFEDDLSPFRDPSSDPAANFPAKLNRMTLQGYFGETLAIIAVEHWGAHGYMDWIVPAFLFRFHDQEFQHLDTINERLVAGEEYNPDRISERRPGRTGDDGFAFRLNSENNITDVLTIEAKCLNRHNITKIVEAHRKLSVGSPRPPGIRELINLLDEYETPKSQVWQKALLELWRSGYRSAIRYDGIGYTCGQVPAREGRVTWMPTSTPHPSYTATRSLDCMEFQFEDLATIIDTLYRGV